MSSLNFSAIQSGPGYFHPLESEQQPNIAFTQSAAAYPLQGHAHPIDPNATLINKAFFQKILKIVHEACHVMYGSEGSDVVLITGPTGSGKSTLINYLAGKSFTRADNAAWDNVRCVEPELMPVGHAAVSCTKIPAIYKDPLNPWSFCDCPGLFDTRPIQRLPNAIALSKVAKQSGSIRCLILCMDYPCLAAMRGEAFERSIQYFKKFLGSEATLDSIFLLITKAKFQTSDGDSKSASAIINELTDYFNSLGPFVKAGNIGFYSPLNNLIPTCLEDEKYIYTREKFQEKIKQFTGIPKSKDTFRIVLDSNVEQYLDECLCQAQMQIVESLKSGKDLDQTMFLFDIIFAMQEVSEASLYMKEKFKALEIAIKQQIQFLGHQDDKEDPLEELKGILPERYKLTIEEALNCLRDRIAKLKQNQEMHEKYEQTIKDFEERHQQNINQLAKTQQDLQEAKISKEEYEKTAQHLSQEIEKVKEERQNSFEEYEKLQRQQEAEKDRHDREYRKLKQMSEEMQQQNESRLAQLQQDLQEAKISKEEYEKTAHYLSQEIEKVKMERQKSFEEYEKLQKQQEAEKDRHDREYQELKKKNEETQRQNEYQLAKMTQDLQTAKVSQEEHAKMARDLSQEIEKSKAERQKAQEELERMQRQQKNDSEQHERRIRELIEQRDRVANNALMPRTTAYPYMESLPPQQQAFPQMHYFDFPGSSEGFPMHQSRSMSHVPSTVRVRSYNRTNGTHVHAYTRRTPHY